MPSPLPTSPTQATLLAPPTAINLPFVRLTFGNNCKNRSLCMEKFSLVLPETPQYYPRRFGICAVIGNSRDLLNKFWQGNRSMDMMLFSGKMVHLLRIIHNM